MKIYTVIVASYSEDGNLNAAAHLYRSREKALSAIKEFFNDSAVEAKENEVEGPEYWTNIPGYRWYDGGNLTECYLEVNEVHS